MMMAADVCFGLKAFATPAGMVGEGRGRGGGGEGAGDVTEQAQERAVACTKLTLASLPSQFAGAAFLGLHMALTHSITVSMIASYMPTGTIPGIGKLSGTAVSFTDFLLVGG